MNSKIKITSKEDITFIKVMKNNILLHNLFFIGVIIVYIFKIARIKNDYSLEFILLYSSPIFLFYYLKMNYLLFYEKMVVDKKRIIIQKSILFIKLKKEIMIEDIEMIVYNKKLLPDTIFLLLSPLYFTPLYRVIFQIKENEKASNQFFFGTGLTEEDYRKIKTILVDKYKLENNIFFIEDGDFS